MITLHFDGSCILGKRARGGWVLREFPGAMAITGNTGNVSCDYPTCNVAEYAGLAGGLEDALRRFGPSELHVYGDSQMVIKQMSGVYKVKHKQGQPLKPYVPYFYSALHAAKQHKSIRWSWIPREQNTEADGAAA